MVFRIDPASGKVGAPAKVGRDAKAMLVTGSSLWVVNATDNTVSQVGVASGAARRTISVGLTPAALTVFNGSVWVANLGDNTISRIDA